MNIYYGALFDVTGLVGNRVWTWMRKSMQNIRSI
ncbi:hypothetical protein ERO13_A11G059150v2 [Gossypium hirsutum]|uniref:Uncharacterized protein n=1 Tax=Gossypium darwinii TaxID=34276 RepID=A0A5D2EIB8_GOSDA|nr:hypothetical protein ERO13_A11G059150v2 [Gossypium hirsutum]TYG92912.1 hypothetical protein ES288_A11G069400v1 [Gossypium darwinii]